MSPARPISPQTNASNRLLRGRRHAEPIRPLRYGTVALLVAFTLATSACGSGDAPTETLFVSVLLLPIVILVALVIWGWAHDTLRESPQEKIDHEFERIARRLRDPDQAV